MVLNKHEKLDGNKYLLDVTIEKDAFNEAVRKEYSKQKNKINVPGFRKGKAPQHIIERLYGEGVFFEDALNTLIPDLYEEAIKEAGIKVIGQPEIDLKSASKAEGANLVFTTELRPELTVKNYKGLEAVKEKVEVTDADVDAEIDRLADRNSRMVTVEDRAAENGDTANIDFEGFVDGVAFDGGKGESYDLVLGSGNFIPGFEEKIVGHNIGEEFDIDVKFPEDYGAENLAGKDSVFKIKLNGLKKKELPEIDDEFAKDVSEFDTIAELRDSKKEEILKRRQDNADAAFENAVVEALAEQLEGDIPETMINDKKREMLRDYDYRLRMQGLSMDQWLKYMGQTAEEFMDTFNEPAKKQVAQRLALEAVARAENIHPTDEEVEAEYARLAEQYNMAADDIKKNVAFEDIRDDVACQKAIDVVKENAKAVDKKEDEPEKKETKKKTTAKKTTSKKAKAEKEEKKDAE